jgi:hypothetical protein
MPLRPERSFPSAALLALTSVIGGCENLQPAAAPPPPSTAAAAAPAPLPPPKCESLSEKCASTPETRTPIANSTLVFTPAAGWFHAHLPSASVAQASEAGPAIAFLGIDVDAKDAKKDATAKDMALAALVKQLGLEPLKRKMSWKKPDDKKAFGGVKAELWQLEEAGVLGAKKGPLLVVAASTGDGKGVIGLGFVPDDHKSSADVAIMKSIESLGKAQ